MLKNKKSSIISLEVLIGVVIAIIIFVFFANIISRFYRLSDASKDSFNQLVALIEEVNQDNHGTRKSIPLRMDKDTAIIGFLKDKESVVSIGEIETKYVKYSNLESIFNKPPNCEKGKACICLCRKPERQEGRNFICEDKNLICKTLDGLDFVGEGFIISRSQMPDILTIKSPLISTEDVSQFRDISVEKYSEYGEELIAVCENLEEGSCVSREYKEEKRAINSLNNFKNFIELCKDRGFVEDEEPCSCGAFNFRSFISEGYSIEFSKFIHSESDKESLKLTLMKGEGEKGSIEVDTNFCVYNLKSDGKNSISYPEKSINLEYNIKYNYVFYYGNYFEEENPQIAFIKYNEEKICLAYHESLDKGYIEPYSEPFDTILIKYDDPLGFVDQSTKLMGCRYPATNTGELWQSG